MSDSPAFVSVDWLHGHLDDPALRLLDLSWYLPQMSRDARAEYLAAHLPGAVFADLEALCDPDSPLPHTLPTTDRFAAVAGRELGVGADTHVVIYDGSGVNLSAARGWWTFRVFGHDRVSVLDGGIGAWRAAGHPVESGAVIPAPARFPDRGRRDDLVRQLDEVRVLAAPATPADASAEAAFAEAASEVPLLVDVRAAARFRGEVPEPREGVRAGHIPGSVNLPFTELVDSATGLTRQGSALIQLLRDAGIDPARPVVATCGSGVTACTLALALHTLGRPDAAVYDGSWTEWGGRRDTPVG